jgi:hypothetical protein
VLLAEHVGREQCGCSGELGTGWVTFVRADIDGNGDKPLFGEYCPPCAAARFGWQPSSAEDYVCVGEPIDRERRAGDV